MAMFHGGGNVYLILPIVRALTARGHRVRVLVGPRIWMPEPPPPAELLAAVAAAGATVIPLPQPVHNPHHVAPARRGLFMGWTPRQLSRGRNLATASWWAQTWAEATAREILRERPDILAADYFLLGAMAAGEAAGISTAVLVHNAMHPAPVPGLPPPGSGFAPARSAIGHLRDGIFATALHRVVARDALPSLNRARSALGLAELDSAFDQYERTARLLILSSAAFDFKTDRLPKNVRYAGVTFDEAPSTPWQSPWPADDRRPLVLVSLSTLDQGQGPVLRNVLEAVSRLPVRALVTLGPAMATGDFRAPLNAKLEVFTPHTSVLPHTAAVISQCGLSTVTKALSFGVPLVCLPILADQPDNAARIVAAGAGIRLRADATPEQIAAATARILADERFRGAARRLQALLNLEHGADTAADELELLATA